MNWPPLVEVAFVVVSQILLAWALTYVVHSTIVLGAAWLIDRKLALSALDRARLWRTALVLPLFTAAIQTGLPLRSGSAAVDVAAISWVAPGNVVVALWVAVAAVLAVCFAVGSHLAGRRQLRHRFGTRTQLPASALLRELAEQARQRVPILTVSERVVVPAAIGCREICVPVILFDAMPVDEKRALLAHELGHLARRDPLWFCFGAAITRALPFQPLSRLALRRLREAAERAADDFAVALTNDPLALASGLTALAGATVLVSNAASATGSPIVVRVERLLTPQVAATQVTKRLLFASIVTAAVGLVLLAPGVRVDVDRSANTIAWLAPGRDEPNQRMLEVRHALRHLNDNLR